ncbi:thymidine kinase [Acholeplasma hippikon]|uniref:Thymidine kinase n=1 Tax=Acholeplasma hippikon TaxID=264636 RepID=A0A449BKJ8_9MOLU|nr:thymidine kinase [Acholeplasma hippikon]VEU82991.1 Thymidine kinase [Acholeplasma hippikon]
MYHTYKNGFIEVVCGPMFAGKTEELIRRAKRLRYAKQKFQVFKPSIDNRYSLKSEIVSHNLLTEDAILINHSSEILNLLEPDTEAVIIDEAQFLDDGVIKIADTLADKGLRVIIGGLDRDFKGEPFGPMPQLLAIAEFVTKLTAICVKTGMPATRTQRIINGQPARYDDPIVVVGASDSYEPRSRHAHEVVGKDEQK